MRLYGVTGRKDAGKTTLVVRLVEHFSQAGLRVATVKHAHAGFDIDQPGRDSHRHRMAGAVEVLVASPRRWALIHELGPEEEPPLADLLGHLSPADLVLVEGYKADSHPKIEVYDGSQDRPPLAAGNATIRALAAAAPVEAKLPVFDRDDVAGIADFIRKEVGL